MKFWANKAGRATSEEPVPDGADVWDLYGSVNTRYVFLAPGGIPAPYESRSLPWAENPAVYHQFVVTGDCVHLRQTYERSEDPALRRDLEDLVDIGYYQWDAPIFAGSVAPAFGDPGGATQLVLPLPLTFYERLGLIRERDLGVAS
ncbi:MAG: TNT domain-containing protein [Microbacterium sp.]|jgi:hypothetical protein|uniref:hypothetical protein n=1 Tax=Microbacterium sp. TaxID=51671 RepID=UPI00282D11B7|nr:hypothetical protein [Microbacterium sp.]MDR2320832.1 TNT domain-containing protein [Microbacterium sp.]